MTEDDRISPDQQIRLEALRLAVTSTQGQDWHTQSILKRADRFEAFLTDGSLE
jgi:hypothetical protein